MFTDVFSCTLAECKFKGSIADFNLVKNNFNDINRCLNLKMGNASYESFDRVIQDARWVKSITTEAGIVFNRLLRSHNKENSSIVAAEVRALHRTLQARSNILAEAQHREMLNMLIGKDLSSDPNGFINAASCVFSYAVNNPQWKLTNRDLLSQIHEKMVVYRENAGPHVDGFDEFLDFTDNVVFSAKNLLTIVVGEVSYTVDKTKILVSSGLIKKMVQGKFKEGGQTSITLKGINSEIFKYFIRYVQTRDASVFERVDLAKLIKLNACCSLLMADFNTRHAIIAAINEKVDDVTIGYTEDHRVELTFQDMEVSEDAIAFIGDPVVQHETGLLDLRGLDSASNNTLNHLLSNFPNTRTLSLKYDPNVRRIDWLALSDVARVVDLHLDFEGIMSVSQDSFAALAQVAAKLREDGQGLRLHVENGGKLRTAALSEIAHILSQTIASLDLRSSQIDDGSLSRVLEKLSNLERLTLDHCKKIRGSNFLTTIKKSCLKIKELSLYRSGRVKEASLVDLFEHAKYLTKLNLGWHHYLTDATLEQLGENCKHLSVVDFTNLKLITDPALKKLVENCKRLAEVRLDYCRSLTSQSLLEMKDHAPDMERLSIFQTFQQEGSPTPLEAMESLMKSRSSSFELEINRSYSNIKSVVAKASKYPFVTVTVRSVE